ncbi:tyrosine-type recombinase/integrase [Legionella pneumophila]|uniref:tyrosine-type recombinase/integrase n=1 Tax=Legionella pneumophila TaxID=446 RepID=UPI003CAEE369
MALKRKNGFWWVDITYLGERVRKSTKTKVRNEAQIFHDQILQELWKRKELKTIPKKTWVDAVVRWIEEAEHKRSLVTDQYHLAWLDSFLRNKLLTNITDDLIEHIAHEKEKTGVKPSSVNRMLELIRAILNKAHKQWKWLESVPVIRMRKFENKRLRWLTKKESQRLLAELPPHLKDMAAFTLATGLRQANVTGLQWKEVDLTKGHALIHPDQSKTKRAIPVPLNSDALEILNRQRGRHPEYVFTYQGNPVSRCNNHAWLKALKRAGIKDFRWHDLRHTWASWHVQNGTSLHELQQLGGWSEYDTVLRYAHLSSDHLRKASERVSGTFTSPRLGS